MAKWWAQLCQQKAVEKQAWPNLARNSTSSEILACSKLWIHLLAGLCHYMTRMMTLEASQVSCRAFILFVWILLVSGFPKWFSETLRQVNSVQISSQQRILGSKKGIQSQCCLESGQHFVQLRVTGKKNIMFSSFEESKNRPLWKPVGVMHTGLFRCFPNIHAPIPSTLLTGLDNRPKSATHLDRRALTWPKNSTSLENHRQVLHHGCAAGQIFRAVGFTFVLSSFLCAGPSWLSYIWRFCDNLNVDLQWTLFLANIWRLILHAIWLQFSRLILHAMQFSRFISQTQRSW